MDLDPLVVTSADSQTPGEISFDPTLAIQPLPANDGADALKHIAGLTVIRKGGTDGDPTFRGMAGSRLPILVDGTCTLGGCGQRMDPPTAYIFPSSFDQVTLLKGPQSVQHGPGSSAGVVLFERNVPRFANPSSSFKLTSNIASYGRRDLSAEALAGNNSLYALLHGSWSEAGDYQDGDENVYNSEYERWNTQAAIGWTPNDTSVLEYSAALSDGQAAYADRGMDGVAFERSSHKLRYRANQLEGIVNSVDAQAYYNYVDHVMDNFTLRDFMPTKMLAMPMVSNPDRLTTGASIKAELAPWHKLESTVGFDTQSNEHSIRKAMGPAVSGYKSLVRVEDATFDQAGLFGEFEYNLSENDTLVFGGRVDFWNATDKRKMIRIGMMNPAMLPNPTSGQDRSETLASSFLRFERELPNSNTSLHAGLGHSQRFPDYWELFNKESTSSISSFDTDPEIVTQIDIGSISHWSDLELSTSLFIADHQDFILVESGYEKPSGMMNRSATVVRNIEATTWGGEAKLSYQNDLGWYTSGALAYTHGTNDTNQLPLAQISPMEFTFEGGRRRQDWSFGYIARFVAEQNRYASKQGNIVGQDIGPTDGFAVFSLHGSYRFNEYWGFAAGIDNLFDETYAEHISRAGSMINGYTQTTRINEPGRTLWARLSSDF
ncbi:TonB-dependent copper receptor [Pelagicoccus mobilis]